jgi:hypothetical protein
MGRAFIMQRNVLKFNCNKRQKRRCLVMRMLGNILLVAVMQLDYQVFTRVYTLE